MSDKSSSREERKRPREEYIERYHSFINNIRYSKKYQKAKNLSVHQKEKVLSWSPFKIYKPCPRLEILDNSVHNINENLRERDFIPTFWKTHISSISKPKLKRESCNNYTSNNNTNSGPLQLKYKEVFREIYENQIKFSSGSYPCSSVCNSHLRRNPIDPRTHANMCMDVTILSDYILCKGEVDLFIFQGYIHSIFRRRKNCGTMCLELKEIFNPINICFRYETISNYTVKPGVMLRLYDVIDFISNNYLQKVTKKIPPFERVILCTQLCEPYPEFLPSQPKIINYHQHRKFASEKASIVIS